MCKQGDIAWVLMADPQGRNHKTRPFVIVSDVDSLPDDSALVGVAVSSQVPHPIPTSQVALPWSLPRHPVTGLCKPSVAIYDWFGSFTKGEIENIRGRVPGNRMVQIMEHVNRQDAAGS